MKITMASRLKDAIVLLIYASIDLSPLVSIMDYKFEEIFSHDRIKKYLKDGYSTQLRLNGDELEIFVYNIDGNSEVIKIHELNDVHDFVEHSFKNFRRSKLETETEVYDGIKISSDKLNQLYCSSNLTTETSEINQIIIRSVFFNKKIDIIKLVSELSDSKWYFGMIMKLFNLGIGQILRSNVIKLAIRYPSKNIKLANKNEDLENSEIKKYLNL